MTETRRLLLLDTHVWIWLMSGDETLRSSRALPEIENAIQSRTLRVSVISVWEVGMLEAQNRIGLPSGCEAWTRQALSAPGTHWPHSPRRSPSPVRGCRESFTATPLIASS